MRSYHNRITPDGARHVGSRRRTSASRQFYAATSAPANSRPRQHSHRKANKVYLRLAALAGTGILAFSLSGLGAGANRLTSNLAVVDLDRVISHERPSRDPLAPRPDFSATYTVDPLEPISEDVPDWMPPVDTAITVAAGAPLNILVMGTDDRSGENGNIGGLAGAQGARSDSTLVVHISGNRDWITAVSIPRDTIVNIPSCPTSSGKYIQAHPATRFNAAFAYGASAGRDVASGALCTLTTVEAITNIHLDGFIVLDMAGFAAMVDALGGVEMDIPNRISAPLAGGLQLDAGTQTLDGWHALQYARARTGVGLGGGSDLERIRRQQKLITAIADQALGSRLLTDSPRLFRFLDATTSSMTTSSNFATVSGLMELATALSAVELENIQFIMAPIYSNPENPNTVLFSSNAKYLWSALQRDSQPVGYK